MATLADCIRQFGPLLNREDVEQLQREGGDSIEGINRFIDRLNRQRTAILERIREAGGDPAQFEDRLSLDEIEFNEFLSGPEREEELAFARWVAETPWHEIKRQYNNLSRTTNSHEETFYGKVLSADAARELWPPYRRDRSTANRFHEPASAIIKKLYRERLAELALAGEIWLFTAGGPAAGKSSGLGLSEWAETAALVLDGTLSKVGSALAKLEPALESGREVAINYVYRDPIASLAGAVERATDTGRVVDLGVVIGTHIGAANTIKELYNRYEGDPRVHFELTDNNHGFGAARPMTISEIPELSRAELMAEGRARLKEWLDDGTIDRKLYDRFLGQEGADRATAPEVAQQEDGGIRREDEAAAPQPVPDRDGAQPPELFSRPEPQPEASPEVTRRRAQYRLALAPAIRQLAGTVDVNVVATTAELPGDSVPADVEGMYRTGQNEVWLVAENLPTADRAKRVLAHEALGHLAMERQPEFAQVLDAVKNLKSIGNRTVRQYAEKVAKTQGLLDENTEAKEILANMVEAGERSSTIDRAVAGVRRLLRRLGLELDYTEADIRELLARAARDLYVSAADKQRALANLPVQQQILADPNAVASAINAAIDEIWAAAELQDYLTEAHSELNRLEEAGHDPERVTELRRALFRARRAAPEGEPLYSRAIHADPEIEAIRARIMPPAAEDIKIADRFRGLRDRLRSTEFTAIKQGLVDSAASVEELEKGLFGKVLDASESAYKAVLATKNLGSVMAAVMHRGIPVLRNGVFSPQKGRKGFIEIFSPITQHADGNLLPLWELYAVARRADRLIGEKNIDGTAREKLLTREEIDRALELGTQYPEFETAFREWNKFNSQAIDLAIKTGVINAEEAAVWRRNDYVPFYRAMEDIEFEGAEGPRPRGRRIEGVRPGIRRLTGSDKPLGHVFENMVMNTAYLIDASFKNEAMQRVVAMADGVAMERIPMAWEAVRIRDGDMARALMRAGLIVGRGETQTDMFNNALTQVRAMTPEQKAHWSKVFRRVAPKGDDVVSVMIGGKPVYYRVHDPLLLRTVGNLGARQWGGVMNIFRFAKRTLTGAVTIDPAFMLANFVRDTLSSWVVADTAKAAPPILEAVRGAQAAWSEDEDTLAIMMAGAGGGGFYDHNPADVRKMLAKKLPKGRVDSFANSVLTPRGLWRFWQKVGNAAEQANRVAKFRQVIREGGSVAEAAYQARDILNFSMSGDYAAMQFLVQTVPFLNARIQGLYRLWRGGRENPVGFAMKGGAIVAATLALLLRNMDREEYEELPEWDKDTYWHFFVGDEHFRLPKPFEVGAMFATVPERMVRAAAGRDDWDLFGERIWKMTAETLQFNPIPQLIKPGFEQYANRSMFTGNPIVPFHLEGLQPEAQYDHWTSETLREWAKLVPDVPGTEWLRSPKRLEAAIRGYTGAVGMYVLGVSDSIVRRAAGHPERPTKPIYDYPVVTRFWRNPQPRSSKYTSELYDMLKEADALYRTMNAYRQQGRLQEASELYAEGRGKLAARKHLHAIATRVREINRQMKIVQFSNASAEKKREAMDRLNRAKLEAVRQVAAVSDLF